MHILLGIPELVLAFLKTLDRKSLLRAALTCRAWKEPALDTLWKDLPSLYPLIQVLSPIAQRVNGSKSLGWVRLSCIALMDIEN